MIKKSWHVLDDINIVDFNPNMYIFTLHNQEKAKEILAKSPWNIMGNLLSLKP